MTLLTQISQINLKYVGIKKHITIKKQNDRGRERLPAEKERLKLIRERFNRLKAELVRQTLEGIQYTIDN